MSIGELYRTRLRQYIRCFAPDGVANAEELQGTDIATLEWLVEAIGGPWNFRAWGRQIGYRPRH